MILVVLCDENQNSRQQQPQKCENFNYDVTISSHTNAMRAQHMNMYDCVYRWKKMYAMLDSIACPHSSLCDERVDQILTPVRKNTDAILVQTIGLVVGLCSQAP